MNKTFKKPLNFVKSGMTIGGGLLVMVSNSLITLKNRNIKHCKRS